MSWSLSTTIQPADDPTEQLEDAFDRWRTTHPGELFGELHEQAEVAITAAVLMFDTVAPLDRETAVTISISGHANPKHDPPPGVSADHITISIIAKQPLRLNQGAI